MGFCVNLFTVDANFEMGPKWIFFTDGQFFFHANLFSSFTRLLMLDLQWQRDGERECVRDRKEREREEITLLMKTSSGKILKVFFKISSLFPYEMFS